MRKRFPTANELVYDNYNFFVIGYCTTERPSDCVVQYPRSQLVDNKFAVALPSLNLNRAGSRELPPHDG